MIDRAIFSDFIKRIESVQQALSSKLDYVFVLAPTQQGLLILDRSSFQPVYALFKSTDPEVNFLLTSNSNRMITVNDVKLVKALEFAFDINHKPNVLSLAYSAVDKQLYIGEQADQFLTSLGGQTNAN